MKETFWGLDIIARFAPKHVEWIPIIDKGLHLPPDLEEEFKKLQSRPDLRQALQAIIDMNRATAQDQYGDAEKAEQWPCVIVARKALANK